MVVAMPGGKTSKAMKSFSGRAAAHGHQRIPVSRPDLHDPRGPPAEDRIPVDVGVVGDGRVHLRGGHVYEETGPVTIPGRPLRIVHPGVAAHETDDGALGTGRFHPAMITGITSPAVEVTNVWR